MRLAAPRSLQLSVLVFVLAAPIAVVRAQETVPQPAENARRRAAEPTPATPPAATSPVQPAPAPEPVAPNTPIVPLAADPTAAPAEPSRTWVEPTPLSPTTPADASVAARSSTEEESSTRPASYEARAVIEPTPGTLREEERIGSYAQPRWTAHRRFPTTRIYVRPEGEFAFEWWLEQKLNLEDPDQARYRSQYEFEFGLGYRLQIDLYLQTEQQGHHGPWELKAEKLELRWALADWGEIPLNPTLYVEYIRQHDAPPKIELKALLGEELASRVHFGLNLVFEHELGDEQENEYAITTGLSYSLVDELFSLGAEVRFATVDVSGDRLSFDAWELLAGPSLAWSPVAPMHVLFVALFGSEIEGDEATTLFQPTMILGWEL
jgi:hypothetical protein